MSLQTLGRRAGILSAAFLAAALGIGTALTGQFALAQTGPELAADAPARHTVRPGDTLWDIASLFLKDPWLWPEIWYVNPQVDNPHLIYPGDVLVLAYGADGRPQLTVERGEGSTRLSPRVRSEPLTGAVTAIPYEAVAAFMSRPSVLDKEQIKSTPHVVSSREQHLIAATGNTIYVKDLAGEVGARYSVVRVGEPLRDPDDRDVVGYRGIYTGDAKLVRNGDPASLEITQSQRETTNGDLLFPSEAEVKLDFIPRAPQTEVEGRIMSLLDAISMVGQYQAVVINRGTRHGLEPGHVLAVYQTGPTVRDAQRGSSTKVAGTFSPKVKLPDERAGTLMVFKTFDRISYALILESETPIRELDRVVNP